jgi:hypothetical protein
MTLREARCAFSKQLAWFVVEVSTWEGYEIAFDEVTDRITAKDPTTDHMKGSLHELGLAADLLLYKDKKYLTNTTDYQKAGELWECLGIEHELPLRWGGRFNDGNHFSFEWLGRR